MAINKDVNYQINVDKGREGGVDSLRRAQTVANGLEESLSDVTREARQLDRALDTAGGSSINLGRAGGGLERVLNATGGGQLGGLLGLAGDIGDVVESLGENGLKGALSALLSPIGVLGVAAGAAAVAVSLINTEYERQKKAAEEYYAYVVSVAQNEESLLQKLREGGTAAIEAVRKTQDDQLALISAGANAIRDEIARLEEEINSRGPTLIIGTDPLLTQLQVAQDQLDALNEEAKKLEPGVMAVVDVMNSAEYASTRAAEALKAGIIDAVSTLGDATSGAENILSIFTDTMEDAKKALDASNKAADEAAKAFTDMQTAAQAAVDSLDAQQSELSRELQSTIADLNADLIEAQKDANADIAKAQADSYASRLRAEADYQKEAARSEEDFRREVSRIRRDAAADERQAIQDNDIAAVLEVREARKQQVSDTRDAYRLERQRRAEDYANQRAVEEAALAARIADIQAARNEEVAAINAEITAERAAHDEQITEIKRLRDGEIERVRAVALANQQRYAEEEAAVARITGQLTSAAPTSTGGIIPFAGPQSTGQTGGLFGGLSPSTIGSGVNVVIQSLNLGEIATPSGVAGAIMNLTELFARAFQQLRVGA